MKENNYKLLYRLEGEHWWFRARRKIIASLIERYLILPKTPRILDIGCGTGQEIKFLNRYGNVKGIDNSKEAVDFCVQSGYAENVMLANADKLPCKENEFDLVVAFDLLEHTKDDQMVLKEIMRVLKSGGYAIFTVPAYNFLWCSHDDQGYHLRRYTKSSFKSKIDKEEFKLIKLSYFNSILFPPIFFVRLARKFLKPKNDNVDLELGFGFLNKPMEYFFAFERHLLRNINFPFGVSIICFVQKK